MLFGISAGSVVLCFNIVRVTVSLLVPLLVPFAQVCPSLEPLEPPASVSLSTELTEDPSPQLIEYVAPIPTPPAFAVVLSRNN